MLCVGFWIVSDGVSGCLDSFCWCLWVSGWCLTEFLGVWMVSDGIFGCLDGF